MCMYVVSTAASPEVPMPSGGLNEVVRNGRMWIAAPVFLCILLVQFVVRGDAGAFSKGDRIPTWLSHVGPANIPLEAYPYYSLPYCRGPLVDRSAVTPVRQGRIIGPKRLLPSAFEVRYRVKTGRTLPVCEIYFSNTTVDTWKEAIDRNYHYFVDLDGRLLKGPVGVTRLQTEESRVPMDGHFLYTMTSFMLYCNQEGKITRVVMATSRPVQVVSGESAVLFYQVQWYNERTPASAPVEKVDVTEENQFLKHLPVLNSAIAVLLLLIVVSRSGNSSSPDMVRDGAEHNRSTTMLPFRPGRRTLNYIYDGVVCSGIQVGCVAIIFVGSACSISPLGGVMIYSAGSTVGGAYVFATSPQPAPSVYWKRSLDIWLASSLLPVVVLLVASFLCCLCTMYGTFSPVPFASTMLLFILWGIVSLLGTMVGVYAARRFCQNVNNSAVSFLGPAPTIIHQASSGRWLRTVGLACFPVGVILPVWWSFMDQVWSNHIGEAKPLVACLIDALYVVIFFVASAGAGFLYRTFEQSMVLMAVVSAGLFIHSGTFLLTVKTLSIFAGVCHVVVTVLGSSAVGICAGATATIGAHISLWKDRRRQIRHE
eukprot:gb/GECG01012776.1/.p1 GENE.gb/GECG01012776.1/~~gb/GECG01012776.1/.p1  ORF type:complete len:595 (+),score=13.77 gb/GECG01012776.1/:1-1785(+)